MGFLRKVGRTFEETKRAFTSGTDEMYVCGSCEETLAEEFEFCPHCGAEAVEPVE